MMEPPENWDSRDAALGLARTRKRLLLRERLVRTRLVVEAHELGDEASEVALAQDERGRGAPAQGARKPFGERVRVRRAGRNPYDPRPRRCEHAGEASAELPVTVADAYGWYRIQDGVPGLLRAPFLAWHVRDRGVDAPASPELEEEKHEDRAEPEVGLHEVTRPRDVIPQERRPALAVASRSQTPHVPLGSSLADMDTEFD